MKRTSVVSLVLGILLLSSTSILKAQEKPAGTRGTASASTMSGAESTPLAVESDPAEDLKKPSASVTKLGGMVGMSPQTSVVAFQWFNFLVLAAAVLYALAKALPKAFRSRSQNIQKDMVEARVATEEAKARLSAVEARMSALDAEIAALRADSDRAGAEEERKLHVQAEEEKARILQSAEQEIAAASAAAQRSLRAYAAGVAVDRAAAQLQITPDDDRVLIERFANRLRPEGSQN